MPANARVVRRLLGGDIPQAAVDNLPETVAALEASIAVASTDGLRPTNAQSADYTLVIGDLGKAVQVDSATAKAVTVPPNASVAFPVGAVIEVVRAGAGAVSLAAGAGVTITGDTEVPAEGASLLLRKTGTNSWWSSIVGVRSGTYPETAKVVYPSTVHVRSTGDDAGNGALVGAPVATLARALTLAGSTPTRIIVQDSVVIPTTVTIPATVALEFARGAEIKPAGGTTTTIAGTVWAGRWQIFNRISGGTVTFATTAPMEATYPEWWGAVGDGVTTDHSALSAAAAATAACSAELRGRANASYAVASGVTLPANARWSQIAVKRVNSTTASAVLTLASGVRATDVQVDCNALVTGTAILASGCVGFRVRRATVVDSARAVANCIQVTGASTDGWVEESTFDGAIVGVRVTGTSRGIHVLNNKTRNTKDRGIYIVGAAGASPREIEVDGNDCRDLDGSGTVRSYIQASGVSGSPLRDIRITRNWCVGPGLSYTATPAGTADQITCTYVDELLIGHNFSLFGGDVGISGSNNTGVTVVGNVSAYNDACGITVGSTTGSVTGATVTGNTCLNNGQNRNGDRAAWARAGINTWAVIGGVVAANTFADTQGSPTQQYGFSYKNCTALRLGQNAYRNSVLAKELDDGGNTDTGYIFDSGITIGAGSTALKKHLRLATTIDFPSIAAQTTSDQTVTVPGAVVGDKATAHPNSLLESGLVIGGAVVTAADTVAVRLGNITTGAIDPSNRTWHVLVWGH